MNERRAKTRISSTFPVFVEVQAPMPGVDENPKLVKGRCIDISETGLQITTQTPLRPEAILRVFVINKNKEPVALAGEVRWTRFQHGRFNAGLRVLPSESTNFREWRQEVGQHLEQETAAAGL